LGSECCLVSGDDKEPAFRNTDIREDEVNAVEGPSGQVDRAKSAIVDLNPLFERAFSPGSGIPMRGMEHDLADYRDRPQLGEAQK
jgi:hypothetical protein